MVQLATRRAQSQHQLYRRWTTPHELGPKKRRWNSWHLNITPPRRFSAKRSQIELFLLSDCCAFAHAVSCIFRGSGTTRRGVWTSMFQGTPLFGLFMKRARPNPRSNLRRDCRCVRRNRPPREADRLAPRRPVEVSFSRANSNSVGTTETAYQIARFSMNLPFL